MLKRFAALFLVVLLSCEVFAAVVGDNDGAAFITKAEFDSMKNDFQSQLNKFNTSIDNKIENAIAGYINGIKKTVAETFDPFVKITAEDQPIWGRYYTYGQISSGFYNQISCVASVFGAAGGAIEADIPLTVGGNANHQYWGMWAQPLNNDRVGYRRGYEFDEDGNVTSIYTDDNIVIILTFTDTIDPYGDEKVVGSWFKNNGFSTPYSTSNLKINTLYVDALQHANARLVWSGGWLTTTNISDNYHEFVYSSLGSGGPSVNLSRNWDSPQYESGRWTHRTSSFFASHKQEGKEKFISTYWYCPSSHYIYAYPEGAEYLENLVDIHDDSSIYTTGRLNQLMYDYTDTVSDLLPFIQGKAYYDGYAGGKRHRFLVSFPKLKMVNSTTNNNLKPVTKHSQAGGNQFNRLSQFKNGYMKYKLNGEEVSPTFYGGVPLFNFDKDYDRVTFKIKCDVNSSSYAGIRLWFKEYEFPNAGPNNYTSASEYNATNPLSGKKYKDEIIVATSTEYPTNSAGYIDLTKNTEVTITLKNLKKGIPYFMKWTERSSGGSLRYGYGKITLLKDFIRYID